MNGLLVGTTSAMVNVIDFTGFANRALRYEHGGAPDAITSGIAADRDELVTSTLTILTTQGTELQGRDSLTTLYDVARTLTEVRIYLNAANTSYISVNAVVTNIRILEALGGYSYLVELTLSTSGDRFQVV